MSYSKEECLEGAFANGNPDTCAESDDPDRCRQMYGQQTGNCGTGYSWNAEENSCESESGIDPECADPSFTSQCTGSHTLLMCTDGKKSTKTCEFGCFEAWCRDSEGETDIAPPEPEEPDPADDLEDIDDVVPDEEENDDEDQDQDEEEGKCDCGDYEICVDNQCEPDPSIECMADTDCEKNEECMNNLCMTKDAECIFDEDCTQGSQCVKNFCEPKPACKSGDTICLSPLILEYCADNGEITTKDCQFGCYESQCLTKEEKEKLDQEKEDEMKCKDGYSQCLSDTTLEACMDGYKTQKMCEFGCKGGSCLTEDKKKCTGWQRLNPFCEEDDADIEDKLETDVETIKDAASGKYMELLDAEIEGETDPAKLRGLKKYKEFLDKAGETMDTVNTTVDSLKDIKRIFLDSYDPSMDIENMPVNKILSKGIFDRMSDAIFGEPTTEAGKEMAEAEDSLTVYEKMLERQAEIDFLKKSRLDRLGNVVAENAKSRVADEIKEKAGDLAGKVAGNAMIAVTVVDYALTSFQDEAKKQMFVGLARAYNRRRADLEKQFPDAKEEQIHAMATKQVQDMPYQDAKGRTFIKYGNLIENKDCQDSSNPLCIDNRVFWTAMDKTYKHTNRKKLSKRDMEQFNRRLEKSRRLEEEYESK